MNEIRARIYAVVAQVPRGRVVTYGQVATLARLPGLARQVGYAMAGIPEGLAIPWHRVINAQGRCSQPDREDRQEQLQLLQAEGVEANAEGRIDLKLYRWEPA